MNQAALFHFAIQKNDRLYQLIVQPGSPWEELEAALEAFKKEFQDLRVQVEAEALKKDQEAKSSPATVEAELVQ